MAPRSVTPIQTTRYAPYVPRPVVGPKWPRVTRVPFAPGLVRAVTPRNWPAPAAYPSISVEGGIPLNLPIGRQNVGHVVGEGIFGGPVTVGDPEIPTEIISPYSDKTVAVRPPMGEEEGWTDVFGKHHGAPVAHTKQWDRGVFDAGVHGFGGFGATIVGPGGSMVNVGPILTPPAGTNLVVKGPCGQGGTAGWGLTANEQAVWSVFGKVCSDGAAANSWMAAANDWLKMFPAGKGQIMAAYAAVGGAMNLTDAYAKAILAQKAAAPASWQSGAPTGPGPMREGDASPPGTLKTPMKTGTKIAIGVGLAGLAAGAFWYIKKRKKAAPAK